MKKFLFLLLVLVCILCSCSNSDFKTIEDLSMSLSPPIKMKLLITSENISAEANVSFFSPNLEVTMCAEFVSPAIISGLKIERHKDGRLFADYEGIISELDGKALNVVSSSCDILQLIRDDLATYGKVVESIDDRYGQIDLEVNGKIVTVFFDKDTNTVLRITSELFDVPLRIDIIDFDRFDDSINENISNVYY